MHFLEEKYISLEIGHIGHKQIENYNEFKNANTTQ